jgi:hypothetical protein
MIALRKGVQAILQALPQLLHILLEDHEAAAAAAANV